MNFDNLEVTDNFRHSRAKNAVKFSNQAEYMGNNFKAVIQEKDLKERQDLQFKQKH